MKHRNGDSAVMEEKTKGKRTHAKSISHVGKQGDSFLIKRAFDNSDFWIKIVDFSTKKRKPKMKKGGIKKKESGVVPIQELDLSLSLKKTVIASGDTSYHGPGDAPSTDTISDNGGPKITNVNVHLLLWGSAWLQITTNPSAGSVVNSIDSILTGPYLNSLSQYGVGRGQLVDAFIITSPNPNNPFSEGDVSDMVWNLIDAGYFPEPDDAGGRNELFAFIMPPNVNYNKTNAIGSHSYANDYDFPFDFDKAWYCWVMNNGTIDFVTRVFSHELAEACTDPEGSAVQVNPRNSSSWNEIGDVCQSTDLLNGVRVQSYWSQRDRACIIPTIPSNPEPPEFFRKIVVNAHFHVVDPVLIGSDNVGDFTLSKSAVVDLNSPSTQIIVTSPVVGGESSADLIFNVTWNNDLSVSVNFNSTLYDGSDVDTSTGNNFNLARDTWQSWWVNHHSGDWIEADSCHIDFDIHNIQKP